ncbi:hypothetical protein GCM10010182_57680 [Actinomadura cremea]|nr:hypothetical protein GCM10010182_57680 [Actinomadura cremea]
MSDPIPRGGDDPRAAANARAAKDGAKAKQQAARMRAMLREREARVQELERRLAALEASTTVQFGRLVAGAARSPKRRGTRLPKELYQLWRKRSAPVAAPKTTDSGRVQLDPVTRSEDRLLVAAPYEGIVVAGVLGARAAETLAAHAKVIRLYPHDAAIALDTADADMLVVDAAAGEPGEPWAYLGVPGMYDRDRALNDVRELAAARDLPLVLWNDADAAAVPATLATLHWDATAATPGRLAELQATPLEPAR